MSPIARVWHGITREADAQHYLQHIETKGLPAYRAVEDNRGAFALSRVSNGVAEFLVISLWDSADALKVFVGSDDITKAVYYPEDRSYLQFPEPKVTHYQLAVGEEFLRKSSELDSAPYPTKLRRNGYCPIHARASAAAVRSRETNGFCGAACSTLKIRTPGRIS